MRKELNDEKLWEEFRNGSNSSFETIYQTFSKELITYGRRIHNDRELILDCVQQLFFNLLERRASLGPTNSIRFYLYKSLRTIIIKELKKNDKLDHEDNWDKIRVDLESPMEMNLIDHEQTVENRVKLQKAVENLTAREKEILYLKFFSGLTNDEISEMLEINSQSVKNTASRAVQKLKGMMISVLTIVHLIADSSLE